MLTFSDMLSGIGGCRLAFEQAGFRCVWSCEKDRSARQTYFLNFNEIPEGDIAGVDAADVPDHDVAVAGLPCTPFSSLGRKGGVWPTPGQTCSTPSCESWQRRGPGSCCGRTCQSSSTMRAAGRFTSTWAASGHWAIPAAWPSIPRRSVRPSIAGGCSSSGPGGNRSTSMRSRPGRLAGCLTSWMTRTRAGSTHASTPCSIHLDPAGPASYSRATSNKPLRLLKATCGRRAPTGPLRPSGLPRGWDQPCVPATTRAATGLTGGRVRKLTTPERCRLMGFPPGFAFWKPARATMQLGNSVSVQCMTSLAREIATQAFGVGPATVDALAPPQSFPAARPHLPRVPSLHLLAVLRQFRPPRPFTAPGGIDSRGRNSSRWPS